MPMTLSVSLLGEQAIVDSETGAPLARSSRAMALLAFLVMGKTRLVMEIAEIARLQGAVIASAQCFGSFGRLALSPVADWLRNASVQSAVATMHLYPIDGAASRVPADATAFAYRDGGWAGVIVGVDPDPANAPAISRWAKDYWSALHPTSAGGAYVNFLMEEGQARVEASYRGNYQRLAAVKRRYDPDNAFHVNQNIQPG
jgi:hypothetical protein